MSRGPPNTGDRYFHRRAALEPWKRCSLRSEGVHHGLLTASLLDRFSSIRLLYVTKVHHTADKVPFRTEKLANIVSYGVLGSCEFRAVIKRCVVYSVPYKWVKWYCACVNQKL